MIVTYRGVIDLWEVLTSSSPEETTSAIFTLGGSSDEFYCDDPLVCDGLTESTGPVELKVEVEKRMDGTERRTIINYRTLPSIPPRRGDFTELSLPSLKHIGELSPLEMRTEDAPHFVLGYVREQVGDIFFHTAHVFEVRRLISAVILVTGYEGPYVIFFLRNGRTQVRVSPKHKASEWFFEGWIDIPEVANCETLTKKPQIMTEF